MPLILLQNIVAPEIDISFTQDFYDFSEFSAWPEFMRCVLWLHRRHSLRATDENKSETND